MIRTSDERAMVRAYLAISEMILEDDRYRQRLAEQPGVELAAAGWSLPDGVAVDVSFFDPHETEGVMFTLDEITRRWAEGIEAGTLELQFADAPVAIEVEEISEKELETLSGGFCVASAIGPMPPPGL